MVHTFKGIVRDLRGKGKPPIQGRISVVDEKSSQDEWTPTKENTKQAEAVAESVVKSGDVNKNE